MHVAVDLNWFLQFIVVGVVSVFGLLYLVRNTASRYFMVDSNFDSDYSLDRIRNKGGGGGDMPAAADSDDSCAVCGHLTSKQCSGCKVVRYCSGACQTSHWHSGHKSKCKDLKSEPKKSIYGFRRRGFLGGSSKILKPSNKILFPYEDFVELFNWDKSGCYPPCGLLNCGNSCFANVALQCLAYTRPLVAYLLEKGHKIECQRYDWCFLCEFQTHLEVASRSRQPFSPVNILSKLTSIGGNLGYGKQEDAHEFMRFAIDNMQLACLDEFGGEKVVHHSYQETTLIQHIFGGRLQSQVICTECNNISSQFENMMDLTVEIHGDAGSLEECLDQFTAKEKLHGDNMYKCDGCNAYVKAWKRLTVQRAPNILTIALKRFQSGRFGKLNKRVSFPETLDLSPYMSDSEDENDVYKLYAVIVHVDMLNASFFGHYICYIKDFRGSWYRIDDCKVASVDLDEVLSQGAYMLLYNRICARPSCLLAESLRESEKGKSKIPEVDPSLDQPAKCLSASGSLDSLIDPGQTSTSNCSGLKINSEEELSSISDAEDETEGTKIVYYDQTLPDVLKLLKEVVVPQEHVVHPNPENLGTSSPMSVDENESLGSQFDVSEGVNRNFTKESLSADNCTSEDSNGICDVSPLAVTSGELLDDVRDANSTSNGGGLHEVRDANSTSMPIKAKCENGLPYSNGVKEAAKKSNGEISASKLKPLFATGFLDNPQRKKSIRPREKVSLGLSDEVSSKIHLNNKKDEKPQVLLKDEEGRGKACTKSPPLFATGFLDRPQRKKSTRPRDKVSLELSDEVSSKIHLNNNKDAKPRVLLKDEERNSVERLV